MHWLNDASHCRFDYSETLPAYVGTKARSTSHLLGGRGSYRCAWGNPMPHSFRDLRLKHFQSVVSMVWARCSLLPGDMYANQSPTAQGDPSGSFMSEPLYESSFQMRRLILALGLFALSPFLFA